MKKFKKISISLGVALLVASMVSIETKANAKDYEVSVCTGGKNVCKGDSSGMLIVVKAQL